MSGATGAGSVGTSSGTSSGKETDGGGRGSAANSTNSHTTDGRVNDPHTTNLQAIKSPATESPSPDTHGSQGEL